MKKFTSILDLTDEIYGRVFLSLKGSLVLLESRMKKHRTIRDLIDGIYRKVFLSVDWFLVPLENRVLNWYVRRYPNRFRARLDACIEKSLQYFEAQPTLIADALFSFTLGINETFEPRLAPIIQKGSEYCRQWKDPHLRMLDRNYDAERDGAYCPNEVNPEELSAPEKPWLTSLYADQLGLTEDYLAELEAIDDNGGYGTTHKLLACFNLKTFSTIPHEAIDLVIESTIAPMVRAQRRSRVDDVYCERVGMLQQLEQSGYHQYVQPAWILRIMRAQMEGGGWYEYRSFFRSQSDQHPSCLALTALIDYRERRLKNRTGDSGPQRRELGQGFPWATEGEGGRTIENTQNGG